MKKHTKRLALLLAGLMVSTALFACDDAYTGTDDGEDDEEEQSESSSKYKNLTPDEIWDALLEAKDFTVEMDGISKNGDDTATSTYKIVKDGDKLMLSAESTYGENTSTQTAYYDLKENRVYEEEDGVWYYKDVDEDDSDLSDLLDDLIPVDLLFEAESYEEAESAKDGYTMKPDAIREELGAPEEVVCEGQMTAKGSVYTFTITAANDVQSKEYTITVKFKSDTVKLPESASPESGNQGESAVDTTKPEDTEQVPVPEPEPDVPETNGKIDYFEVLDLLKKEDSCELILSVEASDGSVDEELHIRKFGDLLYLHISAPDYESGAYMDLSSNLLYTEKEADDDFVWVYETSDSVIPWIDLLNNLVGEPYSFFFVEENYDTYYDYILDEYYWSIKDSVLRQVSNEWNRTIEYASATGEYSYSLSESLGDGKTQSTFITMHPDDYEVNLPDEVLSMDEYEELLEQIEEEKREEEANRFDPTPYTDLNPNELFDAMLNTEELYILWEVNRDQVKIEKSGDILEIGYYYSATDTAQWYYVDLTNQIRYDKSKYYAKEEYLLTWEEILQTLGITRDAYFLRDETYLPFDDASVQLEVNPNAVDYSFRSATLKRYGNEYRYEESISSSRYTKIVIIFHDTDTTLPF